MEFREALSPGVVAAAATRARVRLSTCGVPTDGGHRRGKAVTTETGFLLEDRLQEHRVP